MRSSRKTKWTPAIRVCATTTLVVWLAALVFCSSECFEGNSHCQPSNHDDHDHGQVADSHHEHDQAPDSDRQDGCPKTVCDSLKNCVPPTDSSFVFKQDFILAYILGSAPFSQALAISKPEASIFRQTWRRDWVFTPEVYLGPAFRSHAPPVLL